MIRKWFSVFILISIGTMLLTVPSCGDPQELVSITIQPTNETIGATNIPVAADAGYKVQLTALGSYLHPPVTKDITDQVTWASTDLQMFAIDSSGLLTATGRSCGSALISAALQTNADPSGVSSSGAVVTGYMTASVTCYTGSGSGINTDALTVTFLGLGSGTVTSSPTGLPSCTSPTPCVGAFNPGATVTLTATPSSGSTFGSWVGCDSTSTVNPCSVTLTGNQTVTLTFN
jgi:Divergent InlB B-repeat domain